jgi:rubrerythrin
MSRSFDVKELVRVAVIDERSGKDLYRKMTERAKDSSLKHVFADLVKQEERHEKRFEAMLDDLESSGDEATVQYPDEYVEYLEMIVSGGGMSDAHRKLEDTRDDIGLIDLAAAFEREQLLLQQDMGNILGDAYQSIIDEIIREEQGHLTTLSRARAKLPG